MLSVVVDCDKHNDSCVDSTDAPWRQLYSWVYAHSLQCSTDNMPHICI